MVMGEIKLLSRSGLFKIVMRRLIETKLSEQISAKMRSSISVDEMSVG